MKINDILLQQEALKRTTTASCSGKAEVGSKMKEVTDAEAQKFYQENKERIERRLRTGESSDHPVSSAAGATKRERRDSPKVCERVLRSDAADTARAAVFKIAVDNQPLKGPGNAPVTIVEFTDFQCPSCAMTQPLLEEMVTEYTGKVKLVVRDFPLDQHAHALKAAEAAEAAREQGKYWEYTAVIFKNQSA